MSEFASLPRNQIALPLATDSSPLALMKDGGSLRTQHATDIFVVGGGPAGLAVAIAARQKGFRVMVADGATPPIEKPCGEGMMAETYAALRDLGVEIGPADGYRFSGIAFNQVGSRISAAFPQGYGVGLRRLLLHERLIAAAERCGAQMLWKKPVCGIDADGVQLRGGKVRARWIVGADGEGSRVRRWSRLDSGRPKKTRYASRRHYRVKPWSKYVEIYWGSRAQVYVTPISAEELCAVVMSETVEDASFTNCFRELPELANRLAGAEIGSRERGAITSMRSLQKVQRGNVALVGDASGSVDAITGEGLRLAFQQAIALTDAMLAGSLDSYERAHVQLARRPAFMGELMLWLGRNSRLRSQVLRALHSNPPLFAKLLATHLGVAGSVDIVSAGASLGWRLLTT
jgi:menaquinone-9 beta-reductase